MEKNYRSELVGLLGDPVDGNPTGVMEEAAFAAAGLNYRYITIRVRPEDLDAAMAGVRAFGMKGLNLTMPHKIEVIKHMDALTEAAEIIGAVNTVFLRDGKLIGENTDGKGFVRSLLDEGIPLLGKRVSILGAGGAAKAIGVECALAGADSITIINRNRVRGEALAGKIARHTAARAEFIPWEGKVAVPVNTEILINATCVGLTPNDSEKPEIDYNGIKPGMTVCDVVFNPVMPVFLKEAKERGAKVITGIGMLVNQGALNFSLWTGVEPDRSVMFECLKREFNG